MNRELLEAIRSLGSGRKVGRTRSDIEYTKRVEILTFTVSESEKEIIQTSANYLGLTVSELIRVSVFERLRSLDS